MSISLLLEMAVSADPDRLAIVSGDARRTVKDVDHLAGGGAAVITATKTQHVAYVGVGGEMLPLLLFASARAGRAFTPINYRLSAQGIHDQIACLPDPLVVVDAQYRHVVDTADAKVITSDDFLAAAPVEKPADRFTDPEVVAVVLFTSGTTSRPKAVELTHNNLTSYVTGTVDFQSADTADAALICVPPYHIAGVGAALTNIYAGRKVVYLPNFDAEQWVRLASEEEITTATVVPTHHAGSDRQGARIRRTSAAHPEEPGIRGRKGPDAAPAQGIRIAAPCWLRQRLWVDRDQFDDSSADSRRSSRRARQCRRGACTAARLGRSASAGHRSANSRRGGLSLAAWTDWRAVRPWRAGIGPLHRHRISSRRGGVVPYA